MKKLSLTIAFLAVLSSCMTLDKTPKNIDLVREMPELLGTWKWFETHVGGIVGVFNPTHFRGEEVTITFKEDNIFSISLNDSVVLSDVKYSVTKTSDSPYGDYCIGVSKEVRDYLRQNLGPLSQFSCGANQLVIEAAPSSPSLLHNALFRLQETVRSRSLTLSHAHVFQ